jgi:hypothetical protein
MRGVLAFLTILGAFALAGGVSADTGALPAPQLTDGFHYTWPGSVSLQVAPDPWGGGSIQSTPGYFVDCPLACVRPFDAGASVTLKQTPTDGFTFVGWQVANHGQPPVAGACAGVGNCTVTMDQAKDVVAVYIAPPVNHHGSDFAGGGGGGGGTKFPVTVSLTGPGAGTVTSDPAGISCSPDARAGCSASFTAGSTVTLTATPKAGSAFEVWEGDCSSAPDETCTLTMDGPKSATADFEVT